MHQVRIKQSLGGVFNSHRGNWKDRKLGIGLKVRLFKASRLRGGRRFPLSWISWIVIQFTLRMLSMVSIHFLQAPHWPQSKFCPASRPSNVDPIRFCPPEFQMSSVLWLWIHIFPLRSEYLPSSGPTIINSTVFTTTLSMIYGLFWSLDRDLGRITMFIRRIIKGPLLTSFLSKSNLGHDY